MVVGIFFNEIADLVRRIALQPALVDVDDFIEHARNMKSQCIFIHVLAFGTNFFVGQPTSVRKAKFELIAVIGCFC